jgi:hypothetical protein
MTDRASGSAEHPNHVWSHYFVEGRTHNRRKFSVRNIMDEFTRIRIDRKLNSTDVIDALSDLFILRGVPGHVCLIVGRSSSPRHCGCRKVR